MLQAATASSSPAHSPESLPRLRDAVPAFPFAGSTRSKAQSAGKGFSEKANTPDTPNTHVPLVPCLSKCRSPLSRGESGVSQRASSVTDGGLLVLAVVSINLFALKRYSIE